MQTLILSRWLSGRWCLIVLCCLMLNGAKINAGPVNIGCTSHGAVTTAGYISSDGHLILFDGGPAGWMPQPATYPHVLVPGGPLVLRPRKPGDVWPTVITVSPTNKLMQIVNGGVPQVLLPMHNFPVGAALKFVENGPQPLVLGVTGSGDLWGVDPVTNAGQRINGPMETFPFGTSVTGVAAGGQFHVFAVDHFGTLHYYFGNAGTWSSVAIAGGLLPGTPVAAGVFPVGLPSGQKLNVSAIDPAGNLVLWSKPAGLPWQPPVVIAAGQTPGAPLETGDTAYGPMLSTISAGGNWNVWIYGAMSGWVSHLVGPGFVTGAPIGFSPSVGTFFTIDLPGRMVCANWSGTGWSAGYAMPAMTFTPKLIGRSLIRNPPLSPATVTLINSGTDPLVVQIVDLFDPRQPPEEKIPAGGQIDISLPRESGGTLEEVFLAPGPGGILLEQTERHPIPPQQRFSLTLWSDKETYKVLPFKDAPKGAPKSVTEGFSRRSQVSLGVLPIAPGELLRDGEQFDLVQIAKRLRNPGAVVHFPKPVDQP
ncbi:MAG: hypothetical protein R3C17_13965 [Planctomycetaceae bacterium]